MKDALNMPSVLLKKLIMTAAIGPACFLIGCLYFLYAHDEVFFYISLFIMAACCIKAFALYSVIRKKKYYELNAVCIRVSSKPFSKYRKIRLLDDNLLETEIMIKKDSKIFIGYRYRFYMMKIAHSNIGLKNEYMMAALNHDGLLGYESLGEA